ncbi:hypothetical protein I33_1069 [Bacillus subtilis subsp. subtilis str. RO-NN-1]|nr:hypothetical protein I33_1069 [Bacillus subtilis subsp. subtilis str. RO-NN-1]
MFYGMFFNIKEINEKLSGVGSHTGKMSDKEFSRRAAVIRSFFI